MKKQLTECAICGSQDLARKHLTRSFGHMDGGLLIIDDVPVDACQRCDETYISADVLKKIEGVKNRKGKSLRRSLSSVTVDLDHLVHQLSLSHFRLLLEQKEENLARISSLKTKKADLLRQISAIQNEIVKLGGDAYADSSLQAKTKKKKPDKVFAKSKRSRAKAARTVQS